MTYDRIRIATATTETVFPHDTVFERVQGAVVAIPPNSDIRRYYRGEVGDAVLAFMSGAIKFPINNGVLDITQGWTERRVAQDIADNWTVEEPMPQPAPQEPITRVPRLNMKRIKELEGS